jgi:hypothetical protein
MPKLYLKVSLKGPQGTSDPGLLVWVDLNTDREPQEEEYVDVTGSNRGHAWVWEGEFSVAEPTRSGRLRVCVVVASALNARFDVEIRQDGPEGKVLGEQGGFVVRRYPHPVFLYLPENA